MRLFISRDPQKKLNFSSGMLRTPRLGFTRLLIAGTATSTLHSSACKWNLHLIWDPPPEPIPLGDLNLHLLLPLRVLSPDSQGSLAPSWTFLFCLLGFDVAQVLQYYLSTIPSGNDSKEEEKNSRACHHQINAAGSSAAWAHQSPRPNPHSCHPSPTASTGSWSWSGHP